MRHRILSAVAALVAATACAVPAERQLSSGPFQAPLAPEVHDHA